MWNRKSKKFVHLSEICRNLMILPWIFISFFKILNFRMFWWLSNFFGQLLSTFDSVSARKSSHWNFTVFSNKCQFLLFHLTNFVEIYQISSVFVENFSIWMKKVLCEIVTNIGVVERGVSYFAIQCRDIHKVWNPIRWPFQQAYFRQNPSAHWRVLVLVTSKLKFPWNIQRKSKEF